MNEKEKGDRNRPNLTSTDAKIRIEKDIEKVYEFFRYTTATTLDCMLQTGILRNSITFYVRDLERLGLLRAVYRDNTRRMAKYYSSDPAKWSNSNNKQYSFDFV